MSEPAQQRLAPAEAVLQRRLVGSMALLILAGSGHEILLQLGLARLGIALVIPALAATVVLWRPSVEASIGMTLALAFSLLVPLYTGGGMVLDWVRHYEIALHYGGQASAVSASYLASRTALSEEILGALLADIPAFWLFQLGSVLLNSLWLWPASLLLREAHGGPKAGRLLAVALSPFVLYLSVYTWPWGLAGFFILSAVWLAGYDGREAASGIGMAAAGALLVHPGTAGMVLGLALWVIRARRSAVTAAFASGSVVLLAQIPWIYSVTGGQGPGALFSHSDPGQARVPLLAYAITRPLLAVHTIVPFPPLVRGLEIPDLIFSLLVHSLPGALLTLLVLVPGALRPTGLNAYIVYTALIVNLLIYPSEMYMVGIVESLFVVVLLLSIDVVARLPAGRARRLLSTNAAVAAFGLGLSLWLAVAAPSGDLNRRLQVAYGTRYLVSLLGPLPGLAALAVGAVAAYLAIWRAADKA